MMTGTGGLFYIMAASRSVAKALSFGMLMGHKGGHCFCFIAVAPHAMVVNKGKTYYGGYKTYQQKNRRYLFKPSLHDTKIRINVF
jgi:hypothetical protein